MIKSFSDKMVQSEPIYSLPIGCNGVSWRLKVYPNGNGIVRERYLSVFLELTSGPPGVSRLVKYKIFIANSLQYSLVIHSIRCINVLFLGMSIALK